MKPSYIPCFKKAFIITAINTILIITHSAASFAQEAQAVFSLEELLHLYQRNSRTLSNNLWNYYVDSLSTVNNLLDYRFKSDISFSLPYNKAIESIVQSDGSGRMVERNYLSPVAQLNLSKKLRLTGGQIFASYSISNFTDFSARTRQFSMNWINIRYSQNIFAFNELQYAYKKGSIQQKTQIRNLLLANEDNCKDFAGAILDYHISVNQLRQVEKNIEKARYLLTKSKTLVQYGKLVPGDTLQAANLLYKFEATLYRIRDQSRLQLQQLKNELKQDQDFSIRISGAPPVLILDSALLYERYVQFTVNRDFESKLLEATTAVERARRNSGLSVSVDAGVGVNSKADEEAGRLFTNNPSNRQNVSLNISIPVTGWKAHKNEKAIASWNYRKFQTNREAALLDAGIWLSDMLSRYRQAVALWTITHNSIKNLDELEPVIMAGIEHGKSDYNTLYQLLVDRENAVITQSELLRDIYLLKYEIRAQTLYDAESGATLD